MRILDIVMSFPGIALAAVFVAVFGQSLPVLILRHRVPLHPAADPGRPGQRAGPVRRGLRRGGRVMGARRPTSSPSTWRATASRRSWCSPRCWSPTRSSSRHRCPSSTPAYPPGPVLGQRPRRRPQFGPDRRLVGHLLPRPADPGHRARAEHPGRGHDRRHGLAGRARSPTPLDRGGDPASRRPRRRRSPTRPRGGRGGIASAPERIPLSGLPGDRPTPRPGRSPARHVSPRCAPELQRTDRLVYAVNAPAARGPIFHRVPAARRRGRRRQRVVHRPPRRNDGPGRGVRLRQVDHVDGDHGAAARGRRSGEILFDGEDLLTMARQSTTPSAGTTSR